MKKELKLIIRHFLLSLLPSSLEVGSNGNVGAADIWSDEHYLGARAQFRPDAFPALLRVHDIDGDDAGQYRCRVDFTEAPTRNTLINLTVIGE